MLKDTKANKVLLIIVVLLLGLGAFLTKCGQWQSSADTQDAAFSSGDSLKVSTVTNNIIIEVDEHADRAIFSVSNLENSILSVSRTGNQVVVEVRPKRRWSFGFFSSSPSPLVVTLPTDQLGKLEASSTSGDIEILPALSLDKLEASSVSGEIDFLTLTANSLLKLTTVSGTIHGREAKSEGNLELFSTSGEVEVGTYHGKDILLKSVSGQIEGELILDAGDEAKIETISGSIDVDGRRIEGLSITASTISGAITFNEQDQGNQVSVEKGNAQSHLKLSSTSGGIELHY